MKNINTFVPITELRGKTFVVEDYQRGYKWGKIEIEQLLSDIEKHDSSKGPYCLQPIIIKPIKGLINTYEVIDGQQRLTSLYLLLCFLEKQSEISYSLQYKTRAASEIFLKSFDSISWLNTANSWSEFKGLRPAFNNVDIYHFFQVYKAIALWFNGSSDKKLFFEKLKSVLHIIWYDVTKGNLSKTTSLKAEEVFINFNANKVDLSSAELIKALFILDQDGTFTKDQKKHKAIELALEWDAIESKLHDESFWYFICNDAKYELAETRIDFLFDIETNKLNQKDKLAAYRHYENSIKSEADKQQEWKKIKTLFYKLEEWYNVKPLYHYVGYLIATDLADISTIIRDSKNKTKDAFRQALVNRIKKEFNRISGEEIVYNLATLNFDDDKKECHRLLLLLNVVYYLKDESQNKFPFNLYHQYNWSIEHINPQNPREFNNIDQLKAWIASVKSFFLDNEKIFNFLKDQIDAASDYESLLKAPEFVEKIETAEGLMNVHNITNLALLDRNTNSVLSNRPYLEKRKVILKFDRDGVNENGEPVFIPACTRDLFTKAYSSLEADSPQSFFGADDMIHYFSYIGTELTDFLPSNLNEDGAE